MTKYAVPIFVIQDGYITVEADSEKEAIQKAEALWYQEGWGAVHGVCSDVDFGPEDEVTVDDD